MRGKNYGHPASFHTLANELHDSVSHVKSKSCVTRGSSPYGKTGILLSRWAPYFSSRETWLANGRRGRAGSAARFRCPVPLPSSAAQFRCPVPLPGSVAQFRCLVPLPLIFACCKPPCSGAGSAAQFRCLFQYYGIRAGSVAPFWQCGNPC